MTILKFFGGAAVGGDGPSYHCARLRFASNGLKATPRAARLKSRRFIRSSYDIKVSPPPGDREIDLAGRHSGLAVPQRDLLFSCRISCPLGTHIDKGSERRTASAKDEVTRTKREHIHRQNLH